MRAAMLGETVLARDRDGSTDRGDRAADGRAVVAGKEPVSTKYGASCTSGPLCA